MTVVRQHYAKAKVPFPVALVEDSAVDLASITVELTGNDSGVLLQGAVNWSATFTIPPASDLGERGFAEVIFQIVRDEQIIYQSTQTISQKSFAIDNEPQSNTTFEIASLLHLDRVPSPDTSGIITYTLRAANITLFPQSGSFTGKPTSAAAVGAVTLLAHQVAGGTRNEPLEFENSKQVLIDESSAPLPSAIPLPIPLLKDESVELACIEAAGKYNKDGILLLAVVNWGLRVTSNHSPATIETSALANVTFELLRNDTVIYRTTQSAVQPFISSHAGPIEAATFEIADITYLDIPPRAEKPENFTYTLRAVNVAIIDPITAPGNQVFTSASVGPVTLVAEKIEADKLRKKAKRRRR